MKKIDVFIPTCAKDINKLTISIKQLFKHIKEINNIYICSPQKLKLNTTLDNVFSYSDFEILPYVNLDICKFRKNWIFQQLLKFFQNVTTTEYYLVFDSDSFLIHDLQIFDNNGKPIQYIGAYQNHKPYFDFIQLFSNGEFNREYDGSFICDLGIFNKTYINEMISRFGYTPQSFCELALKTSSLNLHLSEFETYGNYMQKYHSDIYVKKTLLQKEYRKDQFDPNIQIWSSQEMMNILDDKSNYKYDILQIRSGCVNDNMIWEK